MLQTVPSIMASSSVQAVVSSTVVCPSALLEHCKDNLFLGKWASASVRAIFQRTAEAVRTLFRAIKELGQIFGKKGA